VRQGNCARPGRAPGLETSMPDETATMPAPIPPAAERGIGVAIARRQPDLRELDRINELIAAAINTWQLPERVKRISLPLYRYRETDRQFMQFVLAETARPAQIVGVAAVEEADAAECRGGRAMLLHGIYVDPQHHRKGVGSGLLQAAESIALANRAGGLLVRAQPNAAPFFEARGYQGLATLDSARDYAHRFWKPLQTGEGGQRE